MEETIEWHYLEDKKPTHFGAYFIAYTCCNNASTDIKIWYNGSFNVPNVYAWAETPIPPKVKK